MRTHACPVPVVLHADISPCACSYGQLKMGKGAATSISFASPTTLAAGSSDHSVFLFDLKTGESLRRFRGHSGVVNCVDVQRGGAAQGLIASASDDGTVRVWSQESKEELEVVELGFPITAVRFPPPTLDCNVADPSRASAARSFPLVY